MRHRVIIRSRRLGALLLAFGMVVAMASPSAADYCVRNGQKYIVCVDP